MTRTVSLSLFASVALVLLWPFPYIAPIRPPNELSRVYQARALVEDGTLAVNGMLERHGRIFDLSVHDGRYYPNKAPGVSLLGAGVFAVHAVLTPGEPAEISLAESLWVLEKVLCVLPTLLLLPWMRRHLAARFADNAWAAETATVAWVLGSTALTYSLLLYGHQLAAVLGYAGYLAYARAREGRGEGWVVLGGLLSGTAILVEYPAALVALVTGLYAVSAVGASTVRERWRRGARRAALGFAGAALPLGVLLVYHSMAFGSPLATGYSHLEAAGLTAIHEQGWLGVRPPRLDWLASSLFSGRGLVTLSPWVLLALAGLWLARRRPGRGPEVAVAAGVLALFVAFTASWDAAVWGWTVGPRHLTPMLPFLAGPTAATLSWLRDRPGLTGPRLAGAATGLVGASVLLYVVAVVVYPHYPPELRVGAFELALPLLADGYAVHGLGRTLFGWSGPAGHWPVFAGAATAVALPALLLPGRASSRGRLWALGLAVLVMAALLTAMGLAARPAAEVERTRQFVTGHYDPLPR